MASAKQILQHGVVCAVESGYGTLPTFVPATDGLQVVEPPEVQYDYLYDGAIDGKPAGGSAAFKRAKAYGRTGSVDLVHHPRMPGVIYSASVFSSMHNLLRAHGMSATFATNKWTYAPISSGYSSFGFGVYNRGQLKAVRGAYVPKLVLSASGYERAKLVASVKGIANAPSDAGVPGTIDYLYKTRSPQQATNMLITLDNSGSGGASNVALKVREFEFTSERDVEGGANQNDASGDHAGFSLGRRRAELVLLVEATARATTPFISSSAIDPEQLFEQASTFVASLQLGSTQYDRIKLNLPTAQMFAKPEDEADGSIALWRLHIHAPPVDESSDTDWNVVTD